MEVYLGATQGTVCWSEEHYQSLGAVESLSEGERLGMRWSDKWRAGREEPGQPPQL